MIFTLEGEYAMLSKSCKEDLSDAQLTLNRLLVVTGLGIWLSSFAKDLACCPRPFSPPVVRLCELSCSTQRCNIETYETRLAAMSTHGLEYGEPAPIITQYIKGSGRLIP